MMGPSKRQKTYYYKSSWEETYCFVDTSHGTFATNYPENSEIRKKKVCELKSKLSAQKSVVVRPLLKSKNATTALFKNAHLLVKKKKPFQDGELLKEAFLAGAESLFEGFSNKQEIISAIQELQLSDSTVSRRIEAIADDMQSQLTDKEMREWFSLQFDESTDISDMLNKHNEKLSDSLWILNLAFLTDINAKFNILNLDLQGKDKELAQMMGSVKAFKSKLTLWMSQMRSKSRPSQDTSELI
ncbi:hypothetical protein J437_LFUL004378 [Ladona fulva]|uniref:Uncharacterized protein n=1 Tax=Ladona fulva TaxID=123851 RepID=A0A8K0NZ18_LADFU|nr:hypothetical protein J437_LFUL004378 [Ladona fulva]